MARIIDAFEQFFDGNGEPLASGYLSFFENETAIALDTFNDSDQTPGELNPAQVPLDGEGRLTLNVYASVICTGKLYNSVGSLIATYDNIIPRGGLTTGAAFAFWNSIINYQAIISIVTGSDGNIYQAKTDNVNINPVTDFAGGGVNWEKGYFNDFWTADESYPKNKLILSTVNGLEYISVKDSNTGVEPSADTTGTNWVINVKATNWAIGREYVAGEQSISKVDYRRYRSQITQTGNEPSADDGTNWLPVDGVVTTPVNALPANAAVDVSKTPTLTTDAYAITGSTNAQEWVQYQVSSDSFATVAYDSGMTRDFTGHQVKSPLESATTYKFRAITKGVRTDITSFSSVTEFSTVPELADVFAINSETGTGAARFTVTNVDLSASSGSIWTFNRDASSLLKKVDTERGLNELDFAAITVQAANAQGVTSYAATGFNVGTDAGYNGSGNTISSYSFQNKVGFHDTVAYVGNATTRNISHSLSSTVGAIIIKEKDANTNDFVMYHKELGGTEGILSSNGTDVSNLFDSATTTTFGVRTTTRNNRVGGNFIAELFAHNPAQGIYCGRYTGTGSAGLKLTTGFPVGFLLTVSRGGISGVGTMIADIVTGTSSHINCVATGNTKVTGSVSSFDSDGVTLDSNNLNVAGEIYYYIAIANPAAF